MKKLILFAITIFFLSHASAQLMPQGYLSIGFGPSVPVGNYASSGNIYTQGYATAGNLLSLDWAKYYSNFGMSATMSFGSQNLNKGALNKEFGKYSQHRFIQIQAIGCHHA